MNDVRCEFCGTRHSSMKGENYNREDCFWGLAGGVYL
jgi:hypothetical protein